MRTPRLPVDAHQSLRTLSPTRYRKRRRTSRRTWHPVQRPGTDLFGGTVRLVVAGALFTGLTVAGKLVWEEYQQKHARQVAAAPSSPLGDAPFPKEAPRGVVAAPLEGRLSWETDANVRSAGPAAVEPDPGIRFGTTTGSRTTEYTPLARVAYTARLRPGANHSGVGWPSEVGPGIPGDRTRTREAADPAAPAIAPRKAVAAATSASLPVAEAAGQTLVVDTANGNSPYPVTADDTFLGVTVGNTSTGVLNHTAGTLTVSSSLILGSGNGSNGSYNLGGTGNLSTGPVTVGLNGTGAFTQGDASTFAVSPGSLLVLGGGSGSGTYNLNGGTLTVGTVTAGSGTGTFNFNGGTLRAARGDFTSFQGLTTANVEAGGAVIDTQTYGVTVAQSLLHDTAPGAAAIDGGLTKLGTGTLNLSGVNTFTGATNVNAGTLNLLNPLALGNSTLNLSNAANAGTVTFDNTVTARSFTLGGLAGNGNLALASNSAAPVAVALSVGNNGTDTVYAGTLSGAGSLTKVGVGTLTLTGSNTYAGDTTVAAGILAVATGGSITGGSLLVGTVGAPGAALVIGGNGSVDAGGNAASVDGTAANPSSITLGDMGRLSVGNLFVGDGGTGRFVQNGGSLNVGFELALASSPGGGGSFTLNAGGVSATILTVGNYGAGSFTQNGGAVEVISGVGRLNVGANDNGAGSYLLNNGTLITTSTQVSSDAGASTFSQEGGIHISGTLGLAGYNPAARGTYNLDGGTLRVGMVVAGDPLSGNNVTGTSTFNFNGGTLQAGAGGTTFMQGLTTANVRAGGAVIDTAGFNVTIAQSLVHDATGATAGLDGGLTKLGAGTLTLDAANTYTGRTVVHVGTLAVAVNGGLGAGDTTLDDGVILTLDAGVTAAHTAGAGATLTLATANTSIVDLAGTGVQDTVAALIVNGAVEPVGTYGAAGSGATYTDLADFTGTGELLVVPEPSTWSLVGTALALGLTARRRRARARGRS